MSFGLHISVSQQLAILIFFLLALAFIFNLFSNRVGLKKVVEQVVNTQSSGGAMLSEVVSGYESRGGAYQNGDGAYQERFGTLALV